MTTWIFAGVNRKDRLSPELLSRFVSFDLKSYTREEFLGVALEVITSQLGKDPDLARYVAERVVLRTKDVRQAIQVAKLCDTPEEVDRLGWFGGTQIGWDGREAPSPTGVYLQLLGACQASADSHPGHTSLTPIMCCAYTTVWRDGKGACHIEIRSDD